MNQKPKRLLKTVAIGGLFLFLCLAAFVLYGLRLMSIEDRYGDLEPLYWESKDGDIIVNRSNAEMGTIECDWHRIYVKNNAGFFEIDEWLDRENKLKYNVAVYRPYNKIENINHLNIAELKTRARLVTEMTVGY